MKKIVQLVIYHTYDQLMVTVMKACTEPKWSHPNKRTWISLTIKIYMRRSKSDRGE